VPSKLHHLVAAGRLSGAIITSVPGEALAAAMTRTKLLTLVGIVFGFTLLLTRRGGDTADDAPA
jgi:hypothetical protein